MTSCSYKPHICISSINLQNNLYPLKSSFPSRQSISNGGSYSYYGMPQKFSVADGGTLFSLGREVYSRAITKEKQDRQALEKAYANNIKLPAKSIKVHDSHEYIERKRNIAIGKGSIPGSRNSDEPTPFTFKAINNSNINTVRNALRKNRNSGYVVPPKVYNRPTCN